MKVNISAVNFTMLLLILLSIPHNLLSYPAGSTVDIQLLPLSDESGINVDSQHIQMTIFETYVEVKNCYYIRVSVKLINE